MHCSCIGDYRLLWPTYLGSLKKIQNIDKVLDGLATELSLYLRLIIKNVSSRFTDQLQESLLFNVYGQHGRVKFNGPRLSKYLMIGATISVLGDLKSIKRCLFKQIAKRQRPTVCAQSMQHEYISCRMQEKVNIGMSVGYLIPQHG